MIAAAHTALFRLRRISAEGRIRPLADVHRPPAADSGGGGVMAHRYFVYVLKSQRDGSLYVGSTNDVASRVIRHNKGEYRYTKGHRPWEAVYHEEYMTRSEAVIRERYLKTGIGRQELKKFR